MLTAGDIAQMRADLTEVVADSGEAITIRRGGDTLPPQTVRVERRGGGRRFFSEPGSEERRADGIVVGGVTLDIAVGDRFQAGGRLYRVTFVRSNVIMGVQAEVELVE